MNSARKPQSSAKLLPNTPEWLLRKPDSAARIVDTRLGEHLPRYLLVKLK